MFSFIPFPRLITARLVLRQLEMQDDDQIFFLRSDETVNKYLVAPIATSINDARDFIEKINKNITNGESIYWAVTVKGDNRLIGTICIWNFESQENKAEIGYALHPAFSGKGYMHEAVTTVIEYAFLKMKLQYLDAVLDPANKRSITLLQKNRFTYVGASEGEAVFRRSNDILFE